MIPISAYLWMLVSLVSYIIDTPQDYMAIEFSWVMAILCAIGHSNKVAIACAAITITPDKTPPNENA